MYQPVSRRRLVAGGSVTTLAALAGCIAAGSGVTETVDERYETDDIAAVGVETRNGDLRVRTDDRETDTDTLTVQGEKTAASEDDLESIRLVERHVDDRLDLAVERDSSPFVLRLGSNRRIDLDVAVPDELAVERVETRNGRVDVSDVGVDGVLTIETRNGRVDATDVDGNLDATSRNGAIDVSSVGGALEAQTRNGSVDVSDVDGDLTVETRNGAIDVSGVAGDVHAESRNGSVGVRFEEPLDATIDVTTRNGQITVDYDDERITSEESVETTVGDGDRRIEIETRNGDVTVRGPD